MVTPIWLCAFPDGALRKHRGAKRRRAVLPATEWLVSALAECGLPALRRYRHEDFIERGGQPDRFQLVGLAAVAPGTPWIGPLTVWSREALMLREYFGNPGDAYTVSTHETFNLLEPVPLLQRVAAKDGATARIQAGIAHALFKPFGLQSRCVGNARGVRRSGAGEQPCTVAEVFVHWGTPPVFLTDAPCLLVPQPIADLILRGRRADLVFLARWPCQPLRDYPSQAWLSQHRCLGVQDGPPDGPKPQLRSGDFAELAAHMRRWAPTILAHADDTEAAGERMLLERMVTWLDSCASLLQGTPGNEEARNLREISCALL